MGQTLFKKVFDKHAVSKLPSGKTQLFIGLHLIHEVTSPQAFAALDERGLKVKFPERTFATVDHIVPTDTLSRPLKDEKAEEMLQAIENSTKKHGIRFFSRGNGQGIVHVVGPENGLTQPGMTIACGDSHTSTHGAFGSLAFGIGTSQVRDVLATQTMAIDPLKVRRIEVNGELGPGVYAKDVILHIIAKLGVQGGVGYAYEYAGSTIEAMSMEERMTICNMSIEGGARIGYINPDQKTYDYLQSREYTPAEGAAFDKAKAYWESIKSDPDATYDDVVAIEASDIEPTVTWGITPAQSVSVNGAVPTLDEFSEDERSSVKEAYKYMGVEPGQAVKGLEVDVCFIGSCTNGRIQDLREVARLVKGYSVKKGVKALIVPGSQQVKDDAEAEGLDVVFKDAGFEWREPGCSMCLAMNPDRLVGNQRSASSSNRNFKGRQGSSSGRTVLLSPAMVAAAAIAGEIADTREIFKGNM